VQGRLVRQLENGQALNNKFKIIIVATVSFFLGVVATSLFNRSDLADPVLTPRQKELQEIAIEAEKRPFFPAVSPIGRESNPTEQ
jgi:hypothetical protein